MNIKKRGLLLLMTALVGILVFAGCNSAGAGSDAVDLGPGNDGGPAAVSLGSAANYVILAESGISTTGITAITGDIGLNSSAAADLTGFSETAYDTTTTSATSDYVSGNIYTAGMIIATQNELSTASGDRLTAYNTAAGLTDPDVTELGSGDISGLTIEPGLYKWDTGVSINTDVTLWGSDTATWIFQIAGNLTVASGVQVPLAGGALAQNILWQVGSNATLDTTSVFAGTLMTGSGIALNNGATVNGRLYAHTAVTMIANAVTQP